jgi:hypothetical protein
MPIHQPLSHNRQVKLRGPAIRGLTLTGFSIFVALTVCVRASQETIKKLLYAEDGRPLAEAVSMLEARHGWVITYEDPRYVHESDIADVTESVRRDLDQYKPGEAPRVLVPRGGELDFAYDVRAVTNQPLDRAAVLNELLNTQAASSNGGRFRVEVNGEVAHVIPTAVKDINGEFVALGSPLDAEISLSNEERSGAEKLIKICEAVSEATRTRVRPGLFPTNLFFRHRDRQGAEKQRARDILLKHLETVSGGTSLSWRLFYGPGTKTYSLNIRHVVK